MKLPPIIITFFGHREVVNPKTIYKNLFEELEDWLFRPYNAIIGRDLFFFCGGTGEFDGIVSRVLRALNTYDIIAVSLLPQEKANLPPPSQRGLFSLPVIFFSNPTQKRFTTLS